MTESRDPPGSNLPRVLLEDAALGLRRGVVVKKIETDDGNGRPVKQVQVEVEVQPGSLHGYFPSSFPPSTSVVSPASISPSHSGSALKPVRLILNADDVCSDPELDLDLDLDVDLELEPEHAETFAHLPKATIGARERDEKSGAGEAEGGSRFQKISNANSRKIYDLRTLKKVNSLTALSYVLSRYFRGHHITSAGESHWVYVNPLHLRQRRVRPPVEAENQTLQIVMQEILRQAPPDPLHILLSKLQPQIQYQRERFKGLVAFSGDSGSGKSTLQRDLIALLTTGRTSAHTSATMNSHNDEPSPHTLPSGIEPVHLESGLFGGSASISDKSIESVRRSVEAAELVLTAFGNAGTLNNGSSTRFLRLDRVRLHSHTPPSPSNRLPPNPQATSDCTDLNRGGSLNKETQIYLFEKRRVAWPPLNEFSFHILHLMSDPQEVASVLPSLAPESAETARTLAMLKRLYQDRTSSLPRHPAKGPQAKPFVPSHARHALPSLREIVRALSEVRASQDDQIALLGILAAVLRLVSLAHAHDDLLIHTSSSQAPSTQPTRSTQSRSLPLSGRLQGIACLLAVEAADLENVIVNAQFDGPSCEINTSTIRENLGLLAADLYEFLFHKLARSYLNFAFENLPPLHTSSLYTSSPKESVSAISTDADCAARDIDLTFMDLFGFEETPSDLRSLLRIGTLHQLATYEQLSPRGASPLALSPRGDPGDHHQSDGLQGNSFQRFLVNAVNEKLCDSHFMKSALCAMELTRTERLPELMRALTGQDLDALMFFAASQEPRSYIPSLHEHRLSQTAKAPCAGGAQYLWSLDLPSSLYALLSQATVLAAPGSNFLFAEKSGTSDRSGSYPAADDRSQNEGGCFFVKNLTNALTRNALLKSYMRVKQKTPSGFCAPSSYSLCIRHSALFAPKSLSSATDNGLGRASLPHPTPIEDIPISINAVPPDTIARGTVPRDTIPRDTDPQDNVILGVRDSHKKASSLGRNYRKVPFTVYDYIEDWPRQNRLKNSSNRKPLLDHSRLPFVRALAKTPTTHLAFDDDVVPAGRSLMGAFERELIYLTDSLLSDPSVKCFNFSCLAPKPLSGLTGSDLAAMPAIVSPSRAGEANPLDKARRARAATSGAVANYESMLRQFRRLRIEQCIEVARFERAFEVRIPFENWLELLATLGRFPAPESLRHHTPRHAAMIAYYSTPDHANAESSILSQDYVDKTMTGERTSLADVVRFGRVCVVLSERKLHEMADGRPLVEMSKRKGLLELVRVVLQARVGCVSFVTAVRGSLKASRSSKRREELMSTFCGGVRAFLLVRRFVAQVRRRRRMEELVLARAKRKVLREILGMKQVESQGTRLAEASAAEKEDVKGFASGGHDGPKIPVASSTTTAPDPPMQTQSAPPRFQDPTHMGASLEYVEASLEASSGASFPLLPNPIEESLANAPWRASSTVSTRDIGPQDSTYAELDVARPGRPSISAGSLLEPANPTPPALSSPAIVPQKMNDTGSAREHAFPLEPLAERGIQTDDASDLLASDEQIKDLRDLLKQPIDRSARSRESPNALRPQLRSDQRIHALVCRSNGEATAAAQANEQSCVILVKVHAGFLLACPFAHVCDGRDAVIDHRIIDAGQCHWKRVSHTYTSTDGRRTIQRPFSDITLLYSASNTRCELVYIIDRNCRLWAITAKPGFVLSQTYIGRLPLLTPERTIDALCAVMIKDRLHIAVLSRPTVSEMKSVAILSILRLDEEAGGSRRLLVSEERSLVPQRRRMTRTAEAGLNKKGSSTESDAKLLWLGEANFLAVLWSGKVSFFCFQERRGADSPDLRLRELPSTCFDGIGGDGEIRDITQAYWNGRRLFALRENGAVMRSEILGVPMNFDKHHSTHLSSLQGDGRGEAGGAGGGAMKGYLIWQPQNLGPELVEKLERKQELHEHTRLVLINRELGKKRDSFSFLLFTSRGVIMAVRVSQTQRGAPVRNACSAVRLLHSEKTTESGCFCGVIQPSKGLIVLSTSEWLLTCAMLQHRPRIVNAFPLALEQI